MRRLRWKELAEAHRGHGTRNDDLMNQPMLLGFAGPSRSGKTSATTFLAVEHGWESISFADPIRACVLDCMPHWGWRQLHAEKDQPIRMADGGSVSPRQLMRAIGDHVRMLEPRAFVCAVHERVAQAHRRGRSVAIDDVRFGAEAALVREMSGFVVHVQRLGIEYAADHITECGVPVEPFDLVLHNFGNVRALQAEMSQLLLALAGPSGGQRDRYA